MKTHTSAEEIAVSRNALKRNLTGSRDFVTGAMDKLIDNNLIEKDRVTTGKSADCSGIRYYIVYVVAKTRPEVKTYSAADYLDEKAGKLFPTIDRAIADDLEANTWIVEGIPADEKEAPARITIDSGTKRSKFLSSLEGRPVAVVLLRYGQHEKVTPLEDSQVYCYFASREGESSTKSYVDFMLSNDGFEELRELEVDLSKDSGTFCVSGAEIVANPLITRVTSDMPTQFVKSKSGEIVELGAERVNVLSATSA